MLWNEGLSGARVMSRLRQAPTPSGVLAGLRLPVPWSTPSRLPYHEQ
jgi:hypothetical protein